MSGCIWAERQTRLSEDLFYFFSSHNWLHSEWAWQQNHFISASLCLARSKWWLLFETWLPFLRSVKSSLLSIFLLYFLLHNHLLSLPHSVCPSQWKVWSRRVNISFFFFFRQTEPMTKLSSWSPELDRWSKSWRNMLENDISLYSGKQKKKRNIKTQTSHKHMHVPFFLNDKIIAFIADSTERYADS